MRPTLESLDGAFPTYLVHLLLCEVALLGLLNGMRELCKCRSRTSNTTHLGGSADVGGLLRLLLLLLLLKMGRLRSGSLLMSHLVLQLRMLLLLLRLLCLHLRLLLLLHLLLLLLRRLSHGLGSHHLHERILVVGHHAIGELRLLLCHESLELLLVEASGQTELWHHGVALLHLLLGVGWRLLLLWWGLLLLLLRDLDGLLHLTLLA